MSSHPSPTTPSTPAWSPRRRRTVIVAATVVLALLAAFLVWHIAGESDEPAGSPQAVELGEAEIGDELADATVLAVGEATHGTAEFRQAWGLIAEQLAGRGFTTIAWEESAGHVARVDAWVQGGPGTVEDALADFGFNLNRTQETADLLTMLREWNAEVPEEERVHLFGVDVQRPEADRDVALDWLETIDTEAAAPLREALAGITSDSYYDAPESYREAAAELTGAVETAAATAPDDVAATQARLAASALARGAEVGVGGATPALRDQAMADQLSDLVDLRGAQGSEHTLLLAHNGHVDRVGEATAVQGATLGELAVERWGDDYQAIGTDAHEVRLSDAGSEYSFTVTSPIRGLFEGTTMGYLEIAGASAENREVLDAAMPMPSAGSGFTAMQAATPAMHTVTVTPSRSWDAVVFVDETTAVTPVG